MKNIFKHWHGWFAVAIILIGIIILAVGVNYTINSRAQIKNYVETSAYVVGYVERISADSPPLYAEVVEYHVDGETYTAENSMSSSSPKKRGSVMKIAYNPNNPKDCLFLGSEKFAYIFFFVFGAALIIFGSIFTAHLVKVYRQPIGE